MLWRKVFRDIKENKGAYIASTVVLILGLMVFTSFSIVIDNLEESKDDFYTNQNFAHGFAKVEEIPSSEIHRLKLIEGIEDIQGRLVKDVNVLYPKKNKNVYLRLISFDPEEEKTINDFRLEKGSHLKRGELAIWVDNQFFDANNLEINEKVEIIAGGRKRDLRVVGVGKSPEYVYALRTVADFIPSPETFGIAFVPIDVMNTMFPGGFNDVVFTIEAGYIFDDVENEIENHLEPFGLKSLIPREDQTSHALLTDELTMLNTMSTAMPLTFLSVAAMILYIVLKRLTEQQRGQIGILKAFGYTKKEILIHYLSYALIIGIIGGMLGVLLGFVVSYPFTALFQMFFNMPGLAGSFSPIYMIGGVFLSLLFSLIAGYQGCKKVLLLEPAEAMTPPAPPSGKKIWVEKISFIWNMLTVQGMMAVRNISRNKGRSLFIFIGIMFCFAISAFTWAMNDLIQIMMFDQYEKVEVYDVKVTLNSPINEKSVKRELGSFEGVSIVEGIAEVPVTLKNKWNEKEVMLIGIQKDSQLYNIIDKDYKKVKPPTNGILLSERLAKLLDADVGSIISLKSIMARNSDKDKEIEVTGVIPQYLGINAYMDISSMQSFLEQKNLATSVILNIDKNNIPDLQDKYMESELVASVEDAEQRLRNMEEMMEVFGSMIYIYAVIGVIIGFAIIYSSSVITVSERSRELASMMVLGLTHREVLSVITFEQWFLAIFGIISGIPMARIMLLGISETVSSDIFTVPTNITTNAFILAFIVTCLSIFIAQRFAAKKIRSLSLVAVLKSAE